MNTDVRSTFRVLQVSDTHLRPSDAAGTNAWSDLIKYTERTRHDLLVHTGDLVYEDPDEEQDHEYAAAQWRRLTVPSRVIPGNHDVGDSEPDPFRGLITEERLERYRRHFGADRWAVTLGSWLLIGLNSQLFDNVLAGQEAEQWEWFEQQLAANPDAKLAVFIHKPPCLVSLDEDTLVNKTIGLGARARFLELARAGRLKLIACGHLHEFMTLVSHGVLVVAAPSLTRGSAPDTIRGLGLRCNGAVEYLFDEDGVRFQLLYQREIHAPRAITGADVGSQP